MKYLKIALVEYDIIWGSPEANFELVRSITSGAKADIFILPEMFSTGFTMNPVRLAEPFCGPSFRFLQQLAIEHNAVFTASIPTVIGANYFNRLYWIEPNETFTFYDKRHLFSLVGEEKHYKPGTERKLIEYRGWKIMPQICYDLRFPVWSRNNLDYDLIYFVANWPEIRQYPWELLLKARAIENLSYCAGVNRIGMDSDQISHAGGSMVYNPLGRAMDYEQYNSNLMIFELSKDEIQQSRKKFRFLNDRDNFEIFTG